MNNFKSVGIIGTGSFIPEKIVTNHDLAKIVDTSDEWIVSRTGIKERRFASEEIATSDLAYEAAKKAIENAGLTPEDIDLIILATLTPDMILPSTACIVQDKLKAVNAAAFDLSAACSGFLYGITVAKQMVSTGVNKNVVVIGAEAMSKMLDMEDRNTCVLFGDGAGAVVISEVEEGSGILATELGADGSGSMYLNIPGGGSRNPASHKTIDERLHFMKMEGQGVFKFAVRIMSNATKKVIEKAGIELTDIDYMVPHQANIRIIEAAAKKMKLPMEKVKVNLDRIGNTSAGSIPIALDEALKEGKINKGDNVILVGFGGGLTWGSCLIKW
ncbi:beta-ketoacyl-ACP synthase III [Clostridiaceae bacterium HSG29]|nr:beta-ketoacyl-ACP synthase III [Clostridiaceae bacterium HSG29]